MSDGIVPFPVHLLTPGLSHLTDVCMYMASPDFLGSADVLVQGILGAVPKLLCRPLAISFGFFFFFLTCKIKGIKLTKS